MRQLPALDMSSNVTKFWRSYVYIGVLTYSLGASAVLVYSLTTPGPHREAMVILSGLSLIASIAGFRLLGLRLVETQWSKLFFTSWAACTFVFIAVGAEKHQRSDDIDVSVWYQLHNAWLHPIDTAHTSDLFSWHTALRVPLLRASTDARRGPGERHQEVPNEIPQTPGRGPSWVPPAPPPPHWPPSPRPP